MSFELIEFVDTQITEKIKERYCNNRNKYTEQQYTVVSYSVFLFLFLC